MGSKGSMRYLLGVAALMAFCCSFAHAQGACPAGVPVTGNNCYFIAANGADTNNGTSESTPWLHAPGMTNCANICAGVTPSAGTGFIFRGGDTWHASTGSPVGLPWAWRWSGSSGSPIYIGVDKTWYAGGSWTRPVLTYDNPPSATQVASCTYDDSTSAAAITLNTVHYVQLDDFEFTGMCHSTQPAFGHATYINWIGGTYNTLSNNYFHGWTHTACVSEGTYCDTARAITGSTGAGSGQGDVQVGNLIDGSDADGVSMFAVYGDCYDFQQNIVRYVSNGAVCTNRHTVHDNLFEHICLSYDHASHANVYEDVRAWASGNFFYNNLIRDVAATNNFGVWLKTGTDTSTDWIYNNVFYSLSTLNCFLQTQYSSISTNTINYVNNTNDGCVIQFNGNSDSAPYTGTFNFENDHFVGYSAQNLAAVWTNANGRYAGHANVVNLGGEIYQSEATANGQGYTHSNNYAPTSGSDATVGAGNNLTSSCGAAGSALCSDTTLGNTRTPNPRPSTGAWVAGAYLYAGTGSAPKPPTGLTAVVR